MAHISELALFDYVSGKSDLTTAEIEHLQECDDCREDVLEMRRLVQDSVDIEKARRLLAEQTSEEPPEKQAS
jgi:predicted anti-sigma-YlaC factor YlaD